MRLIAPATFTPDWEFLEARSSDRRPGQLPPPPESLGRIISIAERLGEEVDFVRVDFYDLEGRVVFGELTNHPWAGMPTWDRPGFDEWLGSWWHLD